MPQTQVGRSSACVISLAFSVPIAYAVTSPVIALRRFVNSHAERFVLSFGPLLYRHFLGTVDLRNLLKGY